MSGTSSIVIKVPIGMSIARVEFALIKATLVSVENNKPAAARLLGVSLKTLYNKLHAYETLGVPS